MTKQEKNPSKEYRIGVYYEPDRDPNQPWSGAPRDLNSTSPPERAASLKDLLSKIRQNLITQGESEPFSFYVSVMSEGPVRNISWAAQKAVMDLCLAQAEEEYIMRYAAHSLVHGHKMTKADAADLLEITQERLELLLSFREVGS